MPKIHLTTIVEDNVKIGKINLPTMTIFTLLLSVFALFAAKLNKSSNDILLVIFLIAGFISFVLGSVILGWCFLRRRRFDGENKKYLRQNVLLGLAAVTSPVWLIILSLFVIGLNR